jgi:hypothetical protein
LSIAYFGLSIRKKRMKRIINNNSRFCTRYSGNWKDEVVDVVDIFWEQLQKHLKTIWGSGSLRYERLLNDNRTVQLRRVTVGLRKFPVELRNSTARLRGATVRLRRFYSPTAVGSRAERRFRRLIHELLGKNVLCNLPIRLITVQLRRSTSLMGVGHRFRPRATQTWGIRPTWDFLGLAGE